MTNTLKHVISDSMSQENKQRLELADLSLWNKDGSNDEAWREKVNKTVHMVANQ